MKISKSNWINAIISALVAFITALGCESCVFDNSLNTPAYADYISNSNT